MSSYLVDFTDVDKSFIVQNVHNEADAINEGFDRLFWLYPQLRGSREYFHVVTTQIPVNINPAVERKIPCTQQIQETK